MEIYTAPCVEDNSSFMFLENVTASLIHHIFNSFAEIKAILTYMETLLQTEETCFSVPNPYTSQISTISIGSYPDFPNLSRLTLVYQSGTETCLEKCRPFSVLPVLKQPFERASLERFYITFSRKKGLTLRFGLRQKVPTKNALAEIIENHDFQSKYGAKNLCFGFEKGPSEKKIQRLLLK